MTSQTEELLRLKVKALEKQNQDLFDLALKNQEQFDEMYKSCMEWKKTALFYKDKLEKIADFHSDDGLNPLRIAEKALEHKFEEVE